MHVQYTNSKLIFLDMTYMPCPKKQVYLTFNGRLAVPGVTVDINSISRTLEMDQSNHRVYLDQCNFRNC